MMESLSHTHVLMEPNETALMEALPGGFFILRATGHHEILYANCSAIRILGCHTLDELSSYAEGFFDTLLKQDAPKVFCQIENETRQGSISFINAKVKAKSGNMCYLQFLARSVSHPKEGELYYLFLVDPQIPSQIEMIDSLTGLPMQRRFLEYAEKWFQMKTQMEFPDPMLILYFNICHFKNFNLKFGIDEGDHLLKDMADIIQSIFPNDFVSRFSDDHFVVLTYKTDLTSKLIQLHHQSSNVRGNWKIETKIGVYEVETSDMVPSKACDLAKLACDSIQNRPETYYCFYSPHISRAADMKDYVTYHIEHAINNGYIKVYYQPVIRSISTTLCGMEALARWIDPVKGFLSPGEFIPPLEESRQLYKLDLYMIEEVCKRYKDCHDKGLPIVPISFNLSRMDFLTCDIFNKVQELADKYHVPHHMLNIEITESMFVKDGDEIRYVLDKFRDAGYQVWMDDFGSGYSSLNALKDYHFDELKIDMAFLSSFTKKSQDILQGTIRMAKAINVRTLAEGVETKSQFSFLRSIGCEKIQGYYFGKPMPYEELVAHLEKKGIPFETQHIRAYYQPASHLNFLTNDPMAITEYTKEGKSHYLFANQPYLDSLASMDSNSLTASEERFNQKNSPVRKYIVHTLKQAIHTGHSETITYPFHNQFIWLKVKKISSYGGNTLFKSHLVNMSQSANKMEQAKLTGLARNIFHLYDSIMVEDISKNESYPLIFWEKNSYFEPGKHNNLEESVQHYEKQYINPEGQERFRQFANPITLKERIQSAPGHILVDYFRTRIPDGSYRWCRHTIIGIPKTGGNIYLCTVKETYADSSLMEKQLVQVYMEHYMT